MALRKIVYVPDPVLRRKAHTVTDFGAEFQTLVDDMVQTMREAPGVGLAAPQIGISSRLIVVEFGDEEDDDAPKKLFTLANPEIIQNSDDTVNGIEACLSVPDLAGEVERFEEITVKALNRRGQPVKIKAKGWLARIFQHEIDHLNGILFTDRASKIWKPTPEEAELIKD